MDGHAGEDLRLRDVGGENGGQGEQFRLQGIHRLLGDETVAGGGHHHRVHHQLLHPVFLQLPGDDLDQRHAGYHSGLYRVRHDVRKDAVQLFRQKFRRDLHDALDAGRILGHQSCDRAHGVYAIGGHGLDIGLDTGASAGVGPSDRQCCFHCENSFLFLH